MAITQFDVIAHRQGLVFRVDATESEIIDLLDDYAELVAITWRETQEVVDEMTTCLCSRYEVSLSDINPVESFAAFVAGVKGKNARHIAPTPTRTVPPTAASLTDPSRSR
jgi:hypothetical protein